MSVIFLAFFSYFPQDGSCNGLQHYAALGRDTIGATSVNLMPCEEPQDVYSGVAQQVSENKPPESFLSQIQAQLFFPFFLSAHQPVLSANSPCVCILFGSFAASLSFHF